MTTTTMHFGPEWMRAKPQTPARQQPPSPPPPTASAAHQLAASTYSALVAPVTQELDKRDESRPFRYTKEELLRIYKEGGGKAGLNLEVERWEGIVRDIGSEPVGLREMCELEKKLFAGPLNSEHRRRQSTDLMNTLSHPSDRQRSSHPNSATNNTVRYGPFLGRRRDSTDQPPLALPRKLSLSNTQGGTLTLTSPRDALPSPRNRIGAFGSGFDGVLNSGDSWSKKRPSATVSGSGGGILTRGEGKEEDAQRSEIKEEEESTGRHSANTRDRDPAAVVGRSSSPGPDVSPPDAAPNGQVSSSELDSVGKSMADMSLEAQSQLNSIPRVLPTINPHSSAPSSLTDPASIEWSYLDLQGQVQGPFRADLMQKWFDEGYFTPDLLMKRTHIDADWIAVGILERRAAGGKIFLSQISNGPPGLAIHAESPESYSPVHEQNMFNGYQPIPTRTLRTTLDSYLNGSSPTGSPSSSLGGGRFGNGSPDPSAYGGRTGSSVYSSDPNFGGRTFGGRVAFQETISDAQAVNSNSLGRTPAVDTFSAYSGGGDGSPWSAGPGQINQSFNDNEQHPYSDGFSGIGSGVIGNSLPVNHILSFNQEHFGDAAYSGMGSLSGHYDSPVARQPSDVNGMPFNSNLTNDVASQLGAPTQFSQSASVPYATPQYRHSVSTFGDPLPKTSEAPNVTRTPTSAVQPNSVSPWTTHTRPFEPPAAPSPVAPPAQPQVSEWITPQQAQSIDPSPWLTASLPVVDDDSWKEIPGPNSLTFSNLGQHNKLQQQEDQAADDVVVSPMDDAVPLPPNRELAQIELADTVPASVTTVASQSITAATTSDPTPGTQGPTTQKARRKSTTRDIQATASKVASPPAPTVVRDQPPAPAPPAAQPKPVWAVEDDSKKQKGTGATMSLREIQEAEARKAEARKAVEKERERLTRANAAASGNSVIEESQPITTSWGLPTSQAGARGLISSKETSTVGTTSATPAAPVWTNTTPAPSVKKTMREIQEEEERRKKLSVKESVASAAARRAYAETTVKVVPSAQTTGGSWTTIGPNGKPTPSVTNAPRPAANTSPSNPIPTTTTLRSNGTVARQAVTTTVKMATPRIEDFLITPSPDFLKWLGESLKGLNSSVNLEEIMSMLLTFPLDPDQSTVEIISDLIYANSTTLDGRRFASEYVSRRKADAAIRRGTASVSGPSNKPVSIADVVKTPKPVQQEWGFKVVNKKKKGGRP